MTTWFHGDAQTNGIRIHYHRTGDGHQPPVILLHGFADTGLGWSRVARALEQDYDVIMPDARGHGLSDFASPQETGTPRAYMDVVGLIEELGLVRPRLIGHSMGAITALLVAALYPALVHSIILEDPSLHAKRPESAEAHPEQDDDGEKDRPLMALELRSQPRADIIATGRQQYPNWSQEDLELWADAKLQFNPDILNIRGGKSREATPFRYEIFSRIACPILLITRDAERSPTTRQEAEKAAQFWHDGRIISIPGAGHNVRRDQYDQFIAAITTFLKERD